ncbi:MAG: hypothetical protein WKF74_02755 [Pyrinomonadaceae bacterium]
MNKKQFAIVLCVMGVATSALAISGKVHVRTVTSVVRSAFTSQLKVNASSQPLNASSPNSNPANMATSANQTNVSLEESTQTMNVPTHIIYGILFREIAAFKEKAKKREEERMSATFLREHHKKKFKLDDQKDKELERVALQADSEANKIDKEAKKVIGDIRARHPDGAIRPGERLPLPPSQLGTLQRQRNQVVLDAREQLRQAFGEVEFQRFDEAVRQDIVSKLKPVVNAPRRSASAPRPEQPR